MSYHGPGVFIKKKWIKIKIGDTVKFARSGTRGPSGWILLWDNHVPLYFTDFIYKVGRYYVTHYTLKEMKDLLHRLTVPLYVQFIRKPHQY